MGVVQACHHVGRNAMIWKVTLAGRRNKWQRNGANSCFYLRTFHCQCSHRACDMVIPTLHAVSHTRFTRQTRSSRLPLSFKPLHFNHRFSWSTVYSCESLSKWEPGKSSSSVKLLKIEANCFPFTNFPLFRIWDFVRVSRGSEISWRH